MIIVNVRPYAGPDDLTAMKRVLIEGRRASPHSGYIHVGDLDWWRFYLLRRYRWEEIAFVWETGGGDRWWDGACSRRGTARLTCSPCLPSARGHAGLDHRARGPLRARVRASGDGSGVASVIVYVEDDNEPAIRLYESVGFCQVNTVRSYIKRLD